MNTNASETYHLRPLHKADIATVSGWFESLDDLSLFDRTMRVPVNHEAVENSLLEATGIEGASGKCWFAIEAERDSLCGIVGLENINAINGDAILALFIDDAARNKGIGIRAAALVLDMAFNQLRLNRVSSFYRTDNEASRKLTTATGFQKEGCLRKAWFSGGEYIDMICVGLLQSEWTKQRQELASQLAAGTRVKFGHKRSGGWSWPPID